MEILIYTLVLIIFFYIAYKIGSYFGKRKTMHYYFKYPERLNQDWLDSRYLDHDDVC